MDVSPRKNELVNKNGIKQIHPLKFVTTSGTLY
jgi:hypothetical protein